LQLELSVLRHDRNIIFIIKDFNASEILATGFVLLPPNAFEFLTSEYLYHNPSGNFPFVGFIAMTTTMCTLMVDALAIGYYVT